MQLGRTGGTEGAVSPPPPLPPVDSWQSPEKFAFFTSILAWPETSLTVCLLPSIFYILSSMSILKSGVLLQFC